MPVTLFNNREVATAIWVAISLAWSVSQKKIREAMWGLFKASFQGKIVVWVGLMILYVSGMVAALQHGGLWSPAQLKDTVMWFCFTGGATGFSFVSFNASDVVFRKIFIDNIKVVLVLEFLISTYTFSLIGEFFLIPAMTMVAMVDVVAKSDEKYSVVAKITAFIQTVAGLAIVAFASLQAVGHYRDLQSMNTLMSFLLPPVLSILFAPFVYVMALASRYELLFVRLNIGPKKSSSLKRYAKLRIILHCGLNLRLVNQLLSTNSLDLIQIRVREDLTKVLSPKKSPLNANGHR